MQKYPQILFVPRLHLLDNYAVLTLNFSNYAPFDVHPTDFIFSGMHHLYPPLKPNISAIMMKIVLDVIDFSSLEEFWYCVKTAFDFPQTFLARACRECDVCYVKPNYILQDTIRHNLIYAKCHLKYKSNHVFMSQIQVLLYLVTLKVIPMICGCFSNGKCSRQQINNKLICKQSDLAYV